MKRRLLLCLAVAPAALLAARDARCEESRPAPYELARILRSVQDKIAAGDSKAFLSYRTELTRITDRVGEAGKEDWKDPRNVRAAVAIVLSGGDPQLLEPLVDQASGQEQTLVRAALAYGLNHNGEAAELLAGVDARKLDATIAGHVALVQAELVAKKDRVKTLALLADARLLAPGTMIEESALRREVTLAVERGDVEGFEAAATRYVRRFAHSVHMANFRRQLAIDVATRGLADDAQRRARLDATLESVAVDRRQDLYLSIAWEGLKSGSMEVVRWAAAKASALASEDSEQSLRSRLCEAAALVVTDEPDKGRAILEGMPVDRLDEEEKDLLAAALRVAKEIRRETKPAAANAERPRDAAEPAIAASVRSAIAQVDSILGGGKR
jgi:chemotaxis protein MotC